MTTRFHTTLQAARLLAALALVTGPAGAQQGAEIRMQGRCERLVIADADLSGSCAETLVNAVAGSRTSFDFAAEDGQTLSFSGGGAQQERTEDSDPLQPINLVVPGRRGKDGIVRNPAPAVGACRFTTPEKGRTMIDCEVTSQGRTFAGTFVTDAREAGPGAQPKP